MQNCRFTVAVTVLYVAVNIFNYSRPIIAVTNNLIGLIFSGVGHRNLGIYFGDKLGL